HGRVSSAARWGRARMDLAGEQRMKRVVTGHDPTGKSVFASEGEPPRRVAQAATGFEIAEIWSTDGVPRLPVASGGPTVARHQYFPGPGETRFVVARIPPAAAVQRAAAGGVDLAAATSEFYAQLPGLGDVMEPDHPGMHTSQTIDYLVILSGEIDLELD